MKIKLNEETVSMFLGLVIVVVIMGMVFNFFQKRRGGVDVPGVKNDISISQENMKQESKLEDGEYVVKKGDSLWKIAVAQYGDGYRWVEIVKDNQLKTTALEVGQKIKLRLPAEIKGQVTVSPSQDKVVEDGKGLVVDGGAYKVAKGDSLWKIAVAQYGDGYKWIEIWNANKNKLVSPDELEIGMELAVPKLN